MVGPAGVVLFETSDSGVRQIHSYDLATGKLQTLDQLSEACRLEHAVWIGDLEQLACKEPTKPLNEAGYVLVNLDGDVSGTINLPEGKNFTALAYVHDQSALVLTEKWSSLFGGRENTAVWVHNLKNGENLRLAKNENLGSSVVYTDF